MVHYGKPLLNQQWWGFALGFITSEGSWNTLHGINISPTTALLSRWFFSPFGGFLEGSPLWDSPKLPNHCDWLEFRVFFFFFIAGKFQSAGVCKTCSPKWWCYFRRFLNDVFFKSTFLDVMFKGTYSKPCISQRWLYYTKILGYWPTQFSFILVPQIIGFFWDWGKNPGRGKKYAAKVKTDCIHPGFPISTFPPIVVLQGDANRHPVEYNWGFIGCEKTPSMETEVEHGLFLRGVHPPKLTWHWKNNQLKMYLLLKKGDFPASHVSFPGTSFLWNWNIASCSSIFTGGPGPTLTKNRGFQGLNYLGWDRYL